MYKHIETARPLPLFPLSARARAAALTACLLLLAAPWGGAGAAPAVAAEARVAVAANFTAPAREIAARFAQSTGHRARLSFGATGQLYTQITQAAPFDVFLAADEARPARAVAEGLAVSGSRFTYASGRLALYSRDAARPLGPAFLKSTPPSRRIAIANPATAPYGRAAVETLKALGLFAVLRPHLVQGTNIAQTYQFVRTGNAAAGFVALSQIARDETGARWLVPESLHAPIAQDAVLLTRGANNVAARAFLDFLTGDVARQIMAVYGYGPGYDGAPGR